jgi:hypothetical protein
MMVQDEQYKDKVADTYLKRYVDISHETADFYKQQAINMYMTEQFCKGDKYMQLKHTKEMK